MNHAFRFSPEQPDQSGVRTSPKKETPVYDIDVSPEAFGVEPKTLDERIESAKKLRHIPSETIDEGLEISDIPAVIATLLDEADGTDLGVIKIRYPKDDEVMQRAIHAYSDARIARRIDATDDSEFNAVYIAVRKEQDFKEDADESEELVA